MNLEIKIAIKEDLNSLVAALENSALATVYFGTEESRKKAVEEAIDSGNTYAAYYEQECVGFVYFIECGAFHAFPYIHLIAVKDAYRGQGIGRQLLEYVENMLFETKDKVFLVVGDYNPSGRGFYEKLGYVCVGKISGLYRLGIDEYIMMKVHG